VAERASGPPFKCPRCGGVVYSSAPDDWYCREVFCGWEDDHPPCPADEPPFISVRQTRREVLNHLNAVLELLVRHADEAGTISDPMLYDVLDRTNDAIEACYVPQRTVPDPCPRCIEPPFNSPKQVADMFYIVDRDGRLWWGANDPEQARQSVFSQGYTIVRVSPDGTWKVVTDV
jgi:hypothetical protein